MDRNKELKIHRLRLPGRSPFSIRSNRKWCKRRGSSLQCQNCFFVYPLIDCNLKNLSNFKNPLFLSILKRFHTHSCYYIVPSKSKATNLIITFFIYLSNNSTWISNCNTIRRNIFCNNTPCTYYSTISN